HVSRSVTGVILSPNKTLQGMHDLQVWRKAPGPSRRAMHEAVLEAGWAAEALMPHHRKGIAPEHHGRGREVLSLDWTYAHHERGPKIWGVKKAWDHVAHCFTPYQTVVPAVLAKHDAIAGVEVVVQEAKEDEEEMAYLKETVQESYAQMDAARGRILEIFHYRLHQVSDKKRTEIALEIAQQLEHEGHFPRAHYAFDNGVLTLELTRFIESVGKHWGSELESSRHIQWQGYWRRGGEGAAAVGGPP